MGRIRPRGTVISLHVLISTSDGSNFPLHAETRRVHVQNVAGAKNIDRENKEECKLNPNKNFGAFFTSEIQLDSLAARSSLRRSIWGILRQACFLQRSFRVFIQ